MQVFAFGSILAIVQYVFGSHYILFVLYLAMNLADLISGLLVAFVNGVYNSKELVVGLVRKLGYWLLIAVAFAVGAIFQNIGEVLDLDLSITFLVGWFTLASLFFHEIRSAIENLTKMGVGVPTFLTDILSIAETEINNADRKLDGTMIVNTTDPEKDVFRLEFDGNLSELAEKDTITFKVNKEG